MGIIIAIIIILAICYGIIMLIVYVGPWILGAGAVAGISVGTFYAIRNYWSSIKDNISNNALKVTMMVITSLFILGVLGGALYSISQITNTLLQPSGKTTLSNSPGRTTTNNSSETWTNRTVNTDWLNVRSGPSANHTVLFTLPENTVIRVSNIGGSGDWVKIRHNNRDGFVNQRYLR